MRKTGWTYCLLSVALALQPGCGREQAFPSVEIEPVPWTAVDIDDPFWSPRLKINRTVSLRALLDSASDRGRLPSPKLVEAAGYVLGKFPDPALLEELTTITEQMASRLLPDGKPRPWKNLLNGDMYHAGHVFEAASVFHTATGDCGLLDAALVVAEDLDRVFGIDKRRDVSQHEEVKIGLLRLYQHTEDRRWLNLAEFFMDERGRPNGGRRLHGEYAQDHRPVTEQERGVGHAVRATYLYMPLAWLADLTGRTDYREASERIWRDIYAKRTFLTGHFGSHRDHEDFGEDYELPNLSAWNETCAAVGSVIWNHRLFLMSGEAGYLDMLERTLYNAVLSGVSLDGTRWYYQNPLRSVGGFERQLRFGPNCCPPNVARLLASLAGYIYAQGSKDIYVNLFVGSRARIELDSRPVTVTQRTRFPWDGRVSLALNPEGSARFALHIRIPGWSRGRPFPSDLYHYMDGDPAPPVFLVNGAPVEPEFRSGFAVLTRDWQPGDVVDMELPLPVRRVIAHPKVEDDRGMVALERGPIVYCAEGIDNPDGVFTLQIDDTAEIRVEERPDLLGGVPVLTGEVRSLARGKTGEAPVSRPVLLTAVPYFAWANRGAGAMSVWLARESTRTVLPPEPTLASTSRVSSSCGEGSFSDNYPGGKLPQIARRFFPHAQTGSAGFEALSDQVEPTGSADGSGLFFRLRPQSGDIAWVQYDFPSSSRITAAEVYWKDDGEYCRLPTSGRLFIRVDGEWVPVPGAVGIPVRPDCYNRAEFPPVITDGLRLEVRLRGLSFAKGDLGPPDANYLPEDTVWYEGGIIEWKVEGSVVLDPSGEGRKP